MAKHLYLPALGEANLAEPERAAHWAAQERKVLLGIADGILVDEGARIRGVSSVPDPWGRALMFRAAIRPGSRHPLRRRLLQEWRGLLSLLALHALHSYRVEVVPVVVDRRNRFTRALLGLKPRAVELERGTAYDWGDVLMIRVEGVAVGALSPATLVYTGADYAPRLREHGFAMADAAGYLRPPDTADERRYLGAWLHALKTRLNAGILHTDQANPDNGVIQDLNRLLTDWMSELGAGRDVPDVPEVRVADEPLQPASETRLLERYHVYRELLRPLEMLHSGRHSDLALRAQRNRSRYGEVVVITPGLLGRDARVWDSKRLAHLGGDARTAIERHFSGASGTIIDREDISRQQAVWIRPELYFLTDTLVEASEGGSFLAAGEETMNSGRRFLLPFRRQILDFFTPEYIHRELRPAFRETAAEVSFSFSLPVGPAGAMERVERTYLKKGAVPGQGSVSAAAPPVVELFPRYLGSEWRRYYLFQATTGDLEAEPVLADATYQVASRTHTDPGSGARVRITQLSGDTVVEDGALVSSPFPDGLEIVSRSRGEAVGLVLLDTGGERGDLARAWRLGIDFGTSNTNVFRKDTEAENAERWQFRFSQHLRPVTAAPAAVRDPLLERFFVPNRTVDLPVPSLLRIHDDTRREHPLLDYTIPFDWEYQLPGDVYGNLKWEDQDRRTEYFLEALLFLLLVEVADRRIRLVDLACSYPKAFSMNSFAIFRGEVERVRRRLLDDDTRVVGPRQTSEMRKTQVLGPQFEVEGVAAGEFFASRETIADIRHLARKQIAAVCLDVGGGTTDISIWSRNHIVFDASVELAGRQISRLLQRNLRLLEKLFTEPAVAALHQRSNEPALFAARLNVVLRREEDRVRDMLLKHAAHPEVLWLRRMLALEFCAIAFFSAALIGAAARTADGSALKDDMAESGIRLHWGGNAAKFMNWIDFGRYDPDGIAAKMLNAMVFNGLRDTGAIVASEKLGQMQSPGHKSEAAGGLVVMNRARMAPDPVRDDEGADPLAMPFDLPPEPLHTPDTGAGAASYTNAVVCGENVTLDDRELDYLSPLGERVLFDGRRTRFRRTSLDRLGRFLDIFNHFGVRFGLLTDETRIRIDTYAQDIRDSVRSSLVEDAGLPDGQRTLEPVFVSEVRLLMDLLNADRR